MIPRDDEFDVFVSEGVLLEIWRGQHVTVAQQFASDWDGPAQSVTHGPAFRSLSQTETGAANLIAAQQLRAVMRRGTRALVVVAALGTGVGALVAYALCHAWR